MKEVISSKHIFYFSITAALPTLILSVASGLAKDSEQMGWASILVAGLSIGVLQYIILKLSLKYSNNSIIVDCKRLLNPFLANILIFLYLGVIILDSGLISYEIIYYIDYVILGIPYEVSHLVINLLVIYLLYEGIEAFARVNKIGIVLLFFMLALVMGFITYNSTVFSFNRLLPIEINAKKIIKGSLVPSTWFMLIPSILLMLKTYCNNNNEFIRNSILANVLIQVIVIILFAISISTLGVDLAAGTSYPFYNITKLVVSGMEIIVFVTWVIGAILKLGIFYFAAIKGVSDYFVLDNHKNIIIPSAILIYSISLFQYQDILLDNVLGPVTFGESIFSYFLVTIAMIFIYLQYFMKN